MADVVSLIANSGGAYSDLDSWEAAMETLHGPDFNTSDIRPIAEISDDFGVNGLSYNFVTFNSWIADAAHAPIIRAAAGKEYNPITDTGAKLTNQGGYNFLTYNTSLTVKNLGFFNPTLATQLFDNSSKASTYGCYFENFTVIFTSTAYEAINCVNKSALQKALFRGGTTKNCTAIGVGGGEITGQILIQSCTATNCVVYNETTKTAYDSFHGSTLTTCAQNDNGSTALGVGHVDGITTADFTDYANGDYSVAAGSSLIDAGTDLSADFTTDIVGTVRG